MTRILHLAPAERWSAWPAEEGYRPPGLADEGFCHACGDDATLLAVANAFYADAAGDFVVLVVEADALSSPVRWEAPSHPGEAARLPAAATFPHVYGPLDRAAIVAVLPARRTADGRFLGW